MSGSTVTGLGIRNKVKGGFSSDKKGSSSSGGRKMSARGDFKGVNQVAGWVGKGKKPSNDHMGDDHMSAPLSTLKDPASFGPPPKHVHYHGTEAAAATSSPTSSTNATPYRRPPPPGGLGAPVPHEMVEQQIEEQRAAEEAANKPAPPPVPYRVDTSGLNTAGLPAPPVRRIEHEHEASPPPIPSNRPGIAHASKPAPPPRLPPRQTEHPDEYTPDPPPAYNATPASQDGYINQASASRLAQAGVTVPALNIGGQSQSAHHGSPSSHQPPPGQLNELQERFARMNKPSSPTNSPSTSVAAAAAAKKAPPPPPPKKKSLSSPATQHHGQDEPPPVPLGSKPT